MKISNRLKCIAASAVVFVGNAVMASAQTFKGFDTIAGETKSNLATWGKTIIDILSILLGIVAAVRLVPIFIKRGKNEGQTSELLTDWGFTLIFVIVGLQLVKIILLGGA